MPRKKKLIQTPQGVHDILPQDQIWWDWIFDQVREFAKYYDFSRIETPILEFTELFTKSIGLSTDIVEKQMYSFKSKGGDNLTLRPEGTAPIARAYVQHGMFELSQPVKLWHWGPMFRYESPQRGRFRQFNQFGFEIIGGGEPILDVQLIEVLFNILEKLGLKDLLVQINSIGCSMCRPYFKKILKNFFRARSRHLCVDCRKRLAKNPLRILDCKEEKCQRLKFQTPHIVDHLCEVCHDHFKKVLEFLDETEIPYNLNPYLVRGLDYYTKTVFEIWPQKEESFSQSALAGGGRYDDLIKMLSRKNIPAVGAAAGIERLILELKERRIQPPQPVSPQIFLVQLGDMAKTRCLKLFEEFRKANILILESFSKDSIKSQLNSADRSGVKYSLILGQKEVQDGTIILRDMKTGVQEIVKLDKIIGEVKSKLRK